MESATQFIFQIAILIFSVVIHEVSHGFIALALGDKTAQYAGRLTLNPIKHLDPFGSVILPVLLSVMGGPVFGWAKPVPYNSYNLRNQKWGPALVGAAGPASNIVIAFVFAMLMRFTAVVADRGTAGMFAANFMDIAALIVFLNLVLALFNLMPIPPLDGSKVLFAVLPYQWRSAQTFLERYGFFILLFFIFFFSHWIFPVVTVAFRLLTGGQLF